MRRHCWLLLGIALLGVACGGGNGLGPGEARKREDALKERLPLDWKAYREGDFQGAIATFTETLEKADLLEGAEGVKNQVKSEAQNGIGWTFFRMQDLDNAYSAFRQATQLDRRNADAWVGWAGIALAQRRYNDAVQYANQALEVDPDYTTENRQDERGRNLAHDVYDQRHVRLVLAEAYFQLGRYSAADRPDPNNATAQLRLVDSSYRFRDPGQLLEGIAQNALLLQDESALP
ncbi:MAG: tetratricopeptide repeat protein [Candidatus Latescibacteria bacterium]|nr:tetratricopeptide repeat protein [Candidatus Latescibacterota bacterium]